MKMGNTILKATSVALVMTAIFMMNACKKDSSSSSSSTTNNNNASTLTANGATADNAYDDAFNVGVQTGSDASLNSNMQKGGGTTTFSTGTTTNGINSYYCATVTASGTAFPVTVTVDFGSGCKSADNITRSGSITYVFSGRLSTPGTVISATFNNYVVNGYQLGGTYSITNTSTGNTLSLTTAVVGGTITYPNDSSYSFSGTKTVTYVSGDSTNLSTYVFNVTGGYTIANANTGESLTTTVTTPLVRKFNCPFIVSGIASFAYTKGAITVNGTLNYGDGTCDDSAVIAVGAFTKTITL